MESEEWEISDEQAVALKVKTLAYSLLPTRHSPLPSLLKHLQHALGHQKAAGDVDRADEDGDRTQNGGGRGEVTGNLQHTADDDDAADGVGDTHQGRVQCGFDVPDYLPTDKTSQHKDDEVRQERGRSS